MPWQGADKYYFSSLATIKDAEIYRRRAYGFDSRAANETYTLGETAISATSYTNGTDTGAAFKDDNLAAPIYRKPMLINGELAITFFAHGDPQLVLTLANSVDVAENKEVLK